MSDQEIQDEVTEVANGEPDTAQAVENEEPAASDIGENDATEAKAENASEDASAKPTGVQKRIDELTRNRREAERERDYWRDQALGKPQPQAEEAKPESAAPPTLESVDFDEVEYQKQMAQWALSNIDQQLDQRLSAKEQEAQARQQEAERHQRRLAFAAKADEFAAGKPDYYEIANNPDLHINDVMADVIASSDKGPEVLYHLGNNPQEAERIAQLPPTHAALEIGRLEAKISLPKAKTVSEAPPPINAINGGGESPAIDPDKMTPEQFRDWRNKQLMEKRGYT